MLFFFKLGHPHDDVSPPFFCDLTDSLLLDPLRCRHRALLKLNLAEVLHDDGTVTHQLWPGCHGTDKTTLRALTDSDGS